MRISQGRLKAFGTGESDGKRAGSAAGEDKDGISTMSINSLENELIGPVIAGTVKQFWTDVLRGRCVDQKGDVPLTVFQSIPVDGKDNELVSMIVEKAVKMAEWNIPYWAS